MLLTQFFSKQLNELNFQIKRFKPIEMGQELIIKLF